MNQVPEVDPDLFHRTGNLCPVIRIRKVGNVAGVATTFLHHVALQGAYNEDLRPPGRPEDRHSCLEQFLHELGVDDFQITRDMIATVELDWLHLVAIHISSVDAVVKHVE